MNKTSITTLYLYSVLFTLSAWLYDVTLTADMSCNSSRINCGSTLFNMVINQLLQLYLGSKLQIIANADDLAIHGAPVGDNIL